MKTTTHRCPKCGGPINYLGWCLECHETVVRTWRVKRKEQLYHKNLNIEKVQSLLQKGLTKSQTARALNVAPAVITYWLKKSK